MHLWSALKMRERKSFFYSFIHVLSIGLAMQLHYSWPILAVISVYLFYRNLGQVSWLGVAAAILTLIASLVPYLQELASNESIQRESDRYIGYGLVHVYPVLKALLYWLRYGSMLFSNKVIAYSEFDWLTNIEWLKLTALTVWKSAVFIVGAVSVVISARLNWLWWKRIKPIVRRSQQSLLTTQWLELYAFGAVVGVLISAALSPITFSYWHLILVYPFAIIPILCGLVRFLTTSDTDRHDKRTNVNTSRFAHWLNRYSITRTLKAIFTNSGHLRKVLWFSLGYLIVLNLLASHDSIKYSYQSDYVGQVEQYVQQQQLLPK